MTPAAIPTNAHSSTTSRAQFTQPCHALCGDRTAIRANPRTRAFARSSGLPARSVPEISRFLGIVIRMHHREQGPAHFHAWCSRREAVSSGEPLE
jgi:hypothetical protein